MKRHRVGRGERVGARGVSKLTSSILRDLRRQVAASTKREPYPGHKAELLKKIDGDIAYFEESERRGAELGA